MKAHSRERVCSSAIHICVQCVFVSNVCGVYMFFSLCDTPKVNFHKLPACLGRPYTWDGCSGVCCTYKKQPNRNSMLILERLGGTDGCVSGDVIWI